MIQIMRWDSTTRTSQPVALDALPESQSLLAEDDSYWIDLSEATEAEESRIFQQFHHVHPLSLEDITKPRREPEDGAHLPKVEEFPDYLFVIVNPIPADIVAAVQKSKATGTEMDLKRPRNAKYRRPQLSAVITHKVLITHHTDALPCVQNVWSYVLRHGECCHRGPDFLFHLILDAIVDEYAPIVDSISDRLDTLEAKLFTRPVPAILARLMQIKRQVSFMRKTLILEREVLARLIRGEFALIDEREIVYYRNVYDHLVRYTELTESAREMVSDLMQTHLAAVSNRLNEVMKVLTMISTIGMICTMIAGIYGMNFKHMPELEWQYGYPFALGLMAVTATIAMGLFRWKKWI